MQNTNEKSMPELLAPVRDEVSFRAAIAAGADAVYMGLGQLNMRINSPGIDICLLPELVQFAHEHGVKVYIALNVIIYDDEVSYLNELLKKLKQAQVDAVICWDPAVIEAAARHELEIHISTQASVSNAPAAAFYKKLGATRIVPARELTLEQIKYLKENSEVELEVFIHGAMCVSVSGRCFLSQFAHGHSANRGDCLQPCRELYQISSEENKSNYQLGSSYVMSPKDLCALPILDMVIATGVDSLKIEGRSRSPEYIGKVVSVYRRAIAAIHAGSFNEDLVAGLMTELGQVYNRGFSKGFLFGKPTVDDWAGRRNSQATEKKVYVGKLINFFHKTKIAHCRVEALELAVGDKIQIHGNKTGVVEMVVPKMKDDDGKAIGAIYRGNVTFPCTTDLRTGDAVYKIVPV